MDKWNELWKCIEWYERIRNTVLWVKYTSHEIIQCYAKADLFSCKCILQTEVTTNFFLKKKNWYEKRGNRIKWMLIWNQKAEKRREVLKKEQVE